MRPGTWTPEQDYALAFGAALGMSARQIAQSLGSGVTRNAVIGRTHRLGMTLSGKRGRSEKPKIPKERKVRVRNEWTPDQDAALTQGTLEGKTAPQLEKELGRSISAINMRRIALGLSRQLRRFTPEEDAVIRADYENFVHVEETARKLNRSFGVVRQRLFKFGLSRDGRKTRLAERFGVEVLGLSDNPAEIRRILADGERAKKEAAAVAEVVRIAGVIAEMQAAITAGEPREIAFRAAMLQGVTLQAIGDAVGLTRERIRQLTDGKPRYEHAAPPPRIVTCKRCCSDFQVQGRGNRKYCEPCAEARVEEVKEQQRQYAREYQRRLRQTPESKAYRRNWMRRSRIKQKLTDLPPTELASLLRQVANEVVQASKTGGQQ